MLKTPSGKLRARALGIPFAGHPGPLNSITDVPGVEVGYTTLIEGAGPRVVGHGPVRTGVTALLPRGCAAAASSVFAGYFSLNGNGELTGCHWVEESGRCEGPICITNTHSCGMARDATIKWLVQRTGGIGQWALPVTGETFDGYLNDINGFHVRDEHVGRGLTVYGWVNSMRELGGSRFIVKPSTHKAVDDLYDTSPNFREVIDDGTVSPAAAGGSIAFAPEVVIPALIAMREDWGEHVFNAYGFVDALNPTLNVETHVQHGAVVPGVGWFDTDQLGIDQGPILAMTENLRSGLVWRTMQRNPHIARGLRRAGFTGGWLDQARPAR